jgi:hypothetical protein
MGTIRIFGALPSLCKGRLWELMFPIDAMGAIDEVLGVCRCSEALALGAVLLSSGWLSQSMRYDRMICSHWSLTMVLRNNGFGPKLVKANKSGHIAPYLVRGSSCGLMGGSVWGGGGLGTGWFPSLPLGIWRCWWSVG